MLNKLKFLLPKKGSVLVFSLIILSFMLVSALSVAIMSVTEKRASLATDKSSRAFQVADTGVEVVLEKIYKGNPLTLSALGSCSSGDVSDTSAGYVVSFYRSDGTKLTNCSDTNWRSEVAKIKSEGTAGNTRRAVEVAVAASGNGQYQVSCAGVAGSIGTGLIFCVRINTDNGSSDCKYRPDGGGWNDCPGSPSDPW